jgi:hypothetical protein
MRAHHECDAASSSSIRSTSSMRATLEAGFLALLEAKVILPLAKRRWTPYADLHQWRPPFLSAGVASTGALGVASEVLRHALPEFYWGYGILLWVWFVATGIALIRLDVERTGGR